MHDRAMNFHLRRKISEFAEKLLGSEYRIKVLETLLTNGAMNINQLSYKCGLHYQLVNRHIENLKELGLVIERRYGYIRMLEAAFDSLFLIFKRDCGLIIKKE